MIIKDTYIMLMSYLVILVKMRGTKRNIFYLLHRMITEGIYLPAVSYLLNYLVNLRNLIGRGF